MGTLEPNYIELTLCYRFTIDYFKFVFSNTLWSLIRQVKRSVVAQFLFSCRIFAGAGLCEIKDPETEQL